MSKHMIVLDLDGTLLYDVETIHEDTLNYLKTLSKEGHSLVIATGRPYRSAINFYRQLELNTPMINYNGGLITWPNNPDFKTRSILIDHQDIVQIFKANKDYIYNAFCEIGDDIYLLEKRADIMPLLHYEEGVKLTVGPFEETLKEGTNGCIIIAHKHLGQHIEAYIKKHYKNKILCRNWGNEQRYIIELFTPKTNKGEGIKTVSSLLGYPKEKIIAFGDGENDIEMLQYAHIGVAVKNAHPDLLKVADVISPYHHQEFPIERFLIDFFNKNSS